MGPLLCSMVWAVCALPTGPSGLSTGWLHFRPTRHGDQIDAVGVEPYAPRAGDLVLFDSGGAFWTLLDALAGTRPPDHVGMVVQRPDGSLGLLESGPDAHLWVYLLDVPGRLHSFKGRVYVRRLRCPLTPEESARLAEFAEAQEGKRYAALRFMRQITPFRARGPLRAKWFGKTNYDRRNWICSELVAAALSYAGLVDPEVMPANIVYPRDFLDNKYYDLSRWDEAALWGSVPGCVHRVK